MFGATPGSWLVRGYVDAAGSDGELVRKLIVFG
jgi:hypothetical protein